MKIAIFDVEPWEKEKFKQAFKNENLVLFHEELNSSNLEKVKDADIVSSFIDSKFDKKTISCFTKLKAIITRSTGYDHIDIKEAKKKKIKVCNVPYYGSNTVAEHTFALILSLTRKIPQALKKVKDGDFSCDGLTGFDLKGKTIGIVGLGNIGVHVARIAKGFEMNVIYADAKRMPKLERSLRIKFAKLDDLYSKSDIITFHVPLIKQTYHMLNKRNLSKVKHGAYIINTSRGGIIETDALIEGLKSKQIGAAGLDVLEDEELIKDERELISKNFNRKQLHLIFENHVLMDYPNVFITPHNAFNSAEALQRILDTSIENIKGIIKNKPINLVK
ncbi:MAG: NAD(P)-dependent oxidoreductase [Nanoarchaeota archaeon]|nr:NAD(P)-dependent oxidoreductase [Nanoarchaeota archaeon]